MEKVLTILFANVPIILASVCWRRTAKIYNLASVFCFFWWGYSAIPIILVPNEPCNPFTTLYIATFAAFVASPSIILSSPNGNVHSHNRTITDCNSATFIGLWMIITSTAGLFAVINTVLNGFSLIEIFTDPLTTAAKYTVKRYAETLVITRYGQLSLILQYCAVVLGGFLYETVRKKKRRWLVIVMSFVPALFMMLAQSAKGFLFLSGAIFVGSRLAASSDIGSFKFIQRSTIYSGVALGSVTFCSVYLSMAARYSNVGGVLSLDLAPKIFKVLQNYAFGHIFAFNSWFTYYLKIKSTLIFRPEAEGLGFYTFTSIYHALGGTREHKLGTYTEFYIHDNISTNIYTIFRGLILDFGVCGSLLFALLLGFMFIYITNETKHNPASPILQISYVFAFGFIFISYGASLLAWNSVIVAMILAIIVRFIARYPTTSILVALRTPLKRSEQ